MFKELKFLIRNGELNSKENKKKTNNKLVKINLNVSMNILDVNGLNATNKNRDYWEEVKENTTQVCTIHKTFLSNMKI